MPRRALLRYVARFDKRDGGVYGWFVYDRLRQGPCASGDGTRADAMRMTRSLNAANKNRGVPTDGEIVRLSAKDRKHYDGVVRKKIKEAGDKYQLAVVLSDHLQYASDRMHASHVYMIQKQWEALQRMNGYKPMMPRRTHA